MQFYIGSSYYFSTLKLNQITDISNANTHTCMRLVFITQPQNVLCEVQTEVYEANDDLNILTFKR
jgi:hypothetical protein